MHLCMTLFMSFFDLISVFGCTYMEGCWHCLPFALNLPPNYIQFDGIYIHFVCEWIIMCVWKSFNIGKGLFSIDQVGIKCVLTIPLHSKPSVRLLLLSSFFICYFIRPNRSHLCPLHRNTGWSNFPLSATKRFDW